ncbi:MAG: NUDIX hydrolase [Alphaproteobacteria bacterium]|nr:MAG: NUDIX hydrolase [Alphaproteobacteria bacterium]
MARRIEPWRLLESIYSFSDRWLRLRSDTVRLPGGSTLTPYHVIEAADWVNVVAISAAGCILLVEQYRHAVTRTMMEIPAGHVDAGEVPEAAAHRELKEETGYGGGLALDVTKVTAPAQHESETLHLHEIPWVEFVDGLRAGRLRLPEANQMSSLLLLHLLAQASGDPTVQRLKL